MEDRKRNEGKAVLRIGEAVPFPDWSKDYCGGCCVEFRSPPLAPPPHILLLPLSQGSPDSTSFCIALLISGPLHPPWSHIFCLLGFPFGCFPRPFSLHVHHAYQLVPILISPQSKWVLSPSSYGASTEKPPFLISPPSLHPVRSITPQMERSLTKSKYYLNLILNSTLT